MNTKKSIKALSGTLKSFVNGIGYNKLQNGATLVPVVTIYSASFVPWCLVGFQIFLGVYYYQTRSLSTGKKTDHEQYWDYANNPNQCECQIPLTETVFNNSEPPLTSWYAWEGFIYCLPTLVFFGWVIFDLISTQKKFREETKTTRIASDIELMDDSETTRFEALKLEQDSTIFLLNQILYFIPTPLLICIKLSFDGLSEQFNWYYIFLPWMIVCLAYMADGIQNGVFCGSDAHLRAGQAGTRRWSEPASTWRSSRSG